MAKFATNVSGAILLPSSIQVTESISGSVVPLAMFCHLLKYLSKMDLSALLTPTHSDYHRLRRPLHGSIHCSCVAVVYPTLELICDFRPSKFSNYPSRPVPLPEVFVTTRPDPVPKSKTTTRQSLLLSGGFLYQWSLRPKKTSCVRFFRKISVSCTYCP